MDGWLRPAKAVWLWFDERTGFSKPLDTALKHPVPPETADLKRGGWIYLEGVGTLTAFIIQVITGIALATLYIPSTANAYDSLQFITNSATLGSVLRGMHYFGASAMVLFIGLHMLRTFLTGSFKFPRELNWLSGVVLLIVTLIMAFTGQILRWDQDGVWSLVIAVEQAGRIPVIGTWIGRYLLAGKTFGATTLSRMFAYHVFFFPAIIFLVVGLHLYLVLHNGISELPRSSEPVDKKTYRQRYHERLARTGVPYFPDAAWHEIAFGVLMIIGIIILAAVVGPPKLGAPPDPANIQAQPRPDWYFLWYFALLALMRPSFENFFVILGPLVFFLVLFLIPFVAGSGQRSPIRRPWAPAIAVATVIIIGGFWRYGSVAPWSPRFEAQPLNAKQIGASSGPVYDGAQVFYNKGCEFCHTVDGQGGERGPDLTHVFQRLPVTTITGIIASGRGNMPAYVNNLTPQEMNDILAFLQAQNNASH